MKRSLNWFVTPFLVIVASVLIAAAAMYGWFRDGSFMFFWDSYVPLDIHNSFEHLFYNWREHVFPGYETAGWSWLPYWAIISFVRLLTGSLSLAQGSLYVFLLSASTIFFFFLLRFLVSKVLQLSRPGWGLQLGLFGASILYTYNPFTFFYGYFMYNPDTFIFGFLPLNILALLHVFPLKKNEASDRTLFWVIVFFVSLFMMTPGFGVYIFLAQYYIWLTLYLVLHWLSVRKAKPLVYIIQPLLFLLLALLANWWWFFPSLLGFQELYNSQSVLGTTFWFDRGFIPSRLLNSMRLLGVPLMLNNLFSWSEYLNANRWFTLPLFFIPFLVLMVVVWFRVFAHRKTIVYFFAMYLVSLFIVKFSNPPLAEITKFAFEHVPFFGAFRDSYQKAGLFYLFALGILFAMGLSKVLLLLEKKKNALLILGFWGILVATLIVVTSPFFLFSQDNVRTITYSYEGRTYSLEGKTKIPPEYAQLKTALEPECRGTTVAMIPRGGWISSANWLKYGTSYVGQDFLAQTINCNFLTTVVSSTYAEASIEAPYFMLQQGNMEGFKRYLLQTSIGIILIRKDNVPYFPTTWVHVDPLYVKSLIDKDHEFELFYQNDYFDAYRLIPLANDRNFGFTLTSTTAFTNALLATPREHITLSRQMGMNKSYVVINTDKELQLLANKVSLYAPVLNCVGCVDIDVSKPGLYAKDSIVASLKTFVKELVRWNPPRPQAEVISMNLINSHKIFFRLLDSLNKDMIDVAQELLVQYTESITTLEKSLFSYSADFFDVNQKMLEARVYLGAQERELSGVISQAMSNNEVPKNLVIADEQMRLQLYYLTTLLNKLYRKVEDRVFRTDFTNNVYRGRLDVPESGMYQCETQSLVSGITITDIALGEPSRTISIPMQTGQYLEKGSYPISISYDYSWKMAPLVTFREGDYIASAPLGELENAYYRLRFRYPSSLSGRFAVLVTKKEISPSFLVPSKNLDDLANPVLLFETPKGSALDQYSFYDHTFQVNSLDSASYYLYIIPLGITPASGVTDVLRIADIEVTKAMYEQDIRMACFYETENRENKDTMTVDKISPVEYSITLSPGNASEYLLFNQTYSSQWAAYGIVDGIPKKLPHVRNVYANAWHLEDGITTIRIVYESQALRERNLLVTITVFIFIAAMYVYVLKRYE